MSLPQLESVYLTEGSIKELKNSNPNFKFPSPAPVLRFLYELCYAMVIVDKFVWFSVLEVIYFIIRLFGCLPALSSFFLFSSCNFELLFMLFRLVVWILSRNFGVPLSSSHDIFSTTLAFSFLNFFWTFFICIIVSVSSAFTVLIHCGEMFTFPCLLGPRGFAISKV